LRATRPITVNRKYVKPSHKRKAVFTRKKLTLAFTTPTIIIKANITLNLDNVKSQNLQEKNMILCIIRSLLIITNIV